MNNENASQIDKEMAGAFSIRIKFEKNSRQPERIFDLMSGLIRSMQELDTVFSQCVSAKLRPEYFLEDVEAQSLRANIRLFIEDFEDEHLLAFDWKRIVGKFLFRAKHLLLKILEENPKLETAEQLNRVAQDIDLLASESGALQLPGYRAVVPSEMLKAIGSIATSMESLGEKDSVQYMHNEDLIAVKKIEVMNVDDYDAMTFEPIHEGQHDEALKIRKPDFIGNTGWGFIRQGKNISIKIVDEDWLKRFHEGEITLRPGDSMRVRINENVTKSNRTGRISVTEIITIVHGIYREELKQTLIPSAKK